MVGGVSGVSAYAASCFVAYGVNLLLGAAVLLNRRDERLNQAFFIGCAALATWSLAAYVLSLPVAAPEAARWARYLAFSACLMAPVSLRIVSLFTGQPGRRWVLASQTVAVVLAVAIAAEMVVIEVAKASTVWPDVAWRTTPGPFGWLLGGYVVATSAISVVVLARYAYEARGLARARARYLALAAGALCVAMLYDSAIAVVDTTRLATVSAPRPLVPPISALWALVTAYALVRDRLADLGAALRRSVLRAAILVTLAVPFVYLLVQADGNGDVPRYVHFPSIALLAFAVAAFLVPPLRSAAGEGLDRLLGAQSTRHRRALLDFSKQAARFSDAQELVARARFELCSRFGLAAAEVLLHDGRGNFVATDAWRLAGMAPDPAEIADLILYLRQVRGPAVHEEMEEREKRPDLARALEALKRSGASAAFELRSPSEIEGLLYLGARNDGEPLSVEDVEALTILTNQLAIALRNAKLADDLAHSREVIARSERLAAIGTLAAGLAHEIRNPLVSIRTFTQLLPERLDDAEFRSRFLDLTLSEVDRISALVSELLAFARPTPATREPVDLADCIERLCLLLTSQAKGRGVSLEMAADADRSAVVLADEDQLKQVVMNLVLNAVQACAEGGRVRMTCFPADTRTGRMGCIEIHDDGCGIPPQDVSRIFDPFFTTRSDGTGLGLSVAHRIVSAHGGTIEVRSQIGRGSTFVVKIPADVETARALTADSAETLSEEPMRAHG